MSKRIAILGATGSIGQSTLDLVERSPERFEVVSLTAQTNVDALASAARRTGARLAVIADRDRFAELRTSWRVAAAKRLLDPTGWWRQPQEMPTG
jgi:1-deoxy-D-xylulose-5-phosphate reductoisomerase